MIDLDLFVMGYTEAIFFTEKDNLGKASLTRKFKANIRKDCEEFVNKNRELLIEAIDCYGTKQAAADFWLTRNGHGAGYWDGELPQELGQKLTDAAHEMGEVWVEACRGWVYYH